MSYRKAALTVLYVWTLAMIWQFGGSALAEPAFFMGLGDLPGGSYYSQAGDVSGDGSLVVGVSDNGFPQVFLWKRSIGAVPVQGFKLGLLGSIGARISEDGSTLVGTSKPNADPLEEPVPVRWTSAQGLMPTPVASATSADGQIVVGQVLGPAEGARWTNQGGLERLFSGAALDISGDGTVILGANGSRTNAFLWTAGGSFSLPPGLTVLRVSANGKVVLAEGARWTVEGGVEPITALPDGVRFGTPADISHDGSVIVGASLSFNPIVQKAAMWDASHGSRYVADVLRNEYGLGSAISGWELARSRAVSADGRTIVGWGINPAGNTEGWIAYLGTPVPETSTLLLAALAFIPHVLQRRPINRYGPR